MKSLTLLLESILQDCSMRCGADTHRDFITISRRVEHEGISFLTITLPGFCKDFERSIEQGHVDSKCFLGFKRHRALPTFLSGLLSLVFDLETGRLLDEPPEEVIFCIRQVCLMQKKILLPCTHQRTKEAFDGYVQCENDVKRFGESSFSQDGPNIGSTCEWRSRWNSLREQIPRGEGHLFQRLSRRRVNRSLGGPAFADPLKAFGYIADVVWSNVLRRPETLVSSLETRPRHGPGATAERIRGNAKFSHKRWHARLEPYFPFDSFGLPSLNALEEESILSSLDIVEPGMEEPVRVISVPKTLKVPRIIAIEPVCMQYTQQALAIPIVEAIERHPLTSGQVNFTNQMINRELALSSSWDRKYGTLDLSEASDRVHKTLVERMLQTVPTLRSAVMACRSTRANVPGHGTLCLDKFASMGSALCFPIEAMVFFTICILGRSMRLGRLPTSREISILSRGVHVYGDDIIVPSDEVPAIASTLELFGLRVNHAKTFRSSSFRESCGMDAFNGIPITPIYMRRMPPSDRHDGSGLLSFVSFRNQLYRAGFWKTARRVQEMTENIFGQLPHVHDTSPGLGWTSYLGTMSYSRFDKALHRPLVRTYVAKAKERHDPLKSGWYALLKFFLKDGGEPLDKKSLTHSVLRGAVNIKRRWVAPA